MKAAFLFSAVLLSTISMCIAADPVTNNAAAQPRRQGNPPVRSPEIKADRQVTFRLQAPKASEVVVAGQWANGRAAMTKDANGVWSVTVGPIDPGVWEYSFQVDGVSMIDPGNAAIKPMREPRTSILQLPGQPALLHDFQDVPHGGVRQHAYMSKALGRVREIAVYTPPGYDQKTDVRYPVLYLQHGSGDNQATWTVHGKAHWILDNLIAQGRAKPMLIVMGNGHATNPGEQGNNSAMFESELLQDIIPFVEANYRVKAEPACRALVGLSMGGEQALRIGLTHADQFGWIGGFSSAAPSSEAVSKALDDSALNQKIKLLWVACGKDDFLLKRNEDFTALLKEKKIQHEWNLTEGNHSWPVWRRYLGDLAPKLFQ